MNIQELKTKSSENLISQAEQLGIENASTLRKQEILFSILKKLAEKGEEITGGGVLQLLQDGFGFLRAMESNYLPGPDDIYISPSQIRRFGLRTGDTVEGPVRAPRDGERYFALLQVSKINFEDAEKSRHKIAFDNLTPLYPNKQLVMEVESTKTEKKTRFNSKINRSSKSYRKRPKISDYLSTESWKDNDFTKYCEFNNCKSSGMLSNGSIN